MTDPYRPEGSDRPWQGYRTPEGPYEPPTTGIPPQVDPAYAGQVPMYPAGYPPQVPHPTAELPRQYWDSAQPPAGGPPTGGPVGGGEGGPPQPPRFPNWLWLVAGAAVLLVVGMVIALVIANGSHQNSATVTPVSPLPTAPSVPIPTRTPTTTPSPRSPAPSTTPTTPPPTTSTTTGVPETIVYQVTGTGRVLSIAYIDTGGILKTEFNVNLPWSKQVTLTPPASTAAAVTVVNFGEQITCSVSVDGTQVRERTGSILTVCAAAG
ncbi:MmpS family transport accessory protein [[Mycobacterium] crassicus]|uniref:MmpS family transport accessory protein n=1 Tax=[Mycobacterium] crassicus TaxID=2872309 RepID=A0ABU5XNS2_9MYCO|nr:MmpS family transport accessory protein [Mycolicibacter sp. MYC098]MEB3023930.1 MmpS family transport accessory protein [Mycolicibacter sp. MYC098]